MLLVMSYANHMYLDLYVSAPLPVLKRGVYLYQYNQRGLDKVEHGRQRYIRQLGRQLSLGNIDYSELQSGDRKA